MLSVQEGWGNGGSFVTFEGAVGYGSFPLWCSMGDAQEGAGSLRLLARFLLKHYHIT